ncbi:MAG: dUTP diphosphatase [Desulfovibrio sp.]|nr:dUTP diphosphatase [Desulfovibrio sp.]
MTSLSLSDTRINVYFFRDAAKIYGETGLAPATPDAAGIDLRACLSEGDSLDLPPGERRVVPAGIAVEPSGGNVAAFVYSRSGLGAVRGVVVAQGVGVIDPDYRGEISVFLLNTGHEAYTVRKGERIAQMVFQPILRPVVRIAAELGETGRGAGGFGHTGST